MAGKVKFYRGAQGTSLPATTQDGAIFIIERAGTNNLGDMYVDMDNGKRLHITPNSEVTITSTNIGNSATSNYTPAGIVTQVEDGVATYQPKGTVYPPNITLETAGAIDNTSLKPVTAKSVVGALTTAAPNATAPENAITYYSVSNETLSFYQIGVTKTDSVTLGSAVAVKTGDATYTATYDPDSPTFEGMGARLVLNGTPVQLVGSITAGN